MSSPGSNKLTRRDTLSANFNNSLNGLDIGDSSGEMGNENNMNSNNASSCNLLSSNNLNNNSNNNHDSCNCNNNNNINNLTSSASNGFLSVIGKGMGVDCNGSDNESQFAPSCENLTCQGQSQHLLSNNSSHHHHHLHRTQEMDAVSQVAGCGVSQMGAVSVPAIPLGLKRRVGLMSGIALIVGTMIGSGIFLSPRGVLERSGSVGMSLVVWCLSGLLSLLGALCYAELGTLICKSGAEYSYILEAFGGPLAFLFSWLSVFILKPAMLSIICLTLSEYIVSPLFPGCPHSDLLIKLFTVFSIGKNYH